MNEVWLRPELKRFIHEDLLHTEVNVVDTNPIVSGRIVAEEDGILCGARFVKPLLRLLMPDDARPFSLHLTVSEGAPFVNGAVLAEFQGDSEVVRHGIRTALNLMAHLSGIATNTAAKVFEVRETGAKLLDTRKTAPGFRVLEKYAVRVGGGCNHRFSRADGILIKKEDITIDGGIIQAIDKAVVSKAFLTDVEIEVETIEDLKLVISDGRVKHILLDNMTLRMLREAVDLCGRTHVLEASGIGGHSLNAIANTGVHFISTSSLIRGARPLVMKMRITRVIR